MFKVAILKFIGSVAVAAVAAVAANHAGVVLSSMPSVVCVTVRHHARHTAAGGNFSLNRRAKNNNFILKISTIKKSQF